METVFKEVIRCKGGQNRGPDPRGPVSLREAETPRLALPDTQERPREDTVRPRLPAGKSAPPTHSPAGGRTGRNEASVVYPCRAVACCHRQPRETNTASLGAQSERPPWASRKLVWSRQLRPRWGQHTHHPTSVVTNYYKPRGLKQHRFILFKCPGGQELETGVPGLESWCWQGWFLRAAPEENP